MMQSCYPCHEQEEIRDLMVTDGTISTAPIHIREVVGGGVCLAGVTEKEVQTRDEMAQVLEQGSLLRATGSTGMNRRSSRSHAIFTITLEQRRVIQTGRTGAGDLIGFSTCMCMQKVLALQISQGQGR